MKAVNIFSNHQVCFIFLRNVSMFFSARNVNMAKLRKDSCKMTAIHRVRREDRFMYGPLTKKGNQTLEKSTCSSQSSDVVTDPELWWHLKLAKCMMKVYPTTKPFSIVKAKKIKIRKKIDALDCLSNRNKKKVVVITKEHIVKSDVSKEIEEVETTCDKRDTENKHNDVLETKDIANYPNSLLSRDTKLLDVVVNNMTSFPIINLEKKLEIIANKVEILSLSAKDEPTTLHYPSVTKILAETLSPQSRKALELWKAKLIAKMGVDKFNEYNQELLKNGSVFHSCIENSLYGRSIDIPDNIQPAFDSLSNIVKELKDIRAIESHVSHNHLHYKGKIDCVAVYRGELCAIDWKKSDRDKKSLTLTYDAPVQIAAYIGALNYSKNYPFTVNCGLIVIGYTNGKPGDAYIVKDNILKTYWKKWLAKLQQYWSSVSKND